MIPNVDREVEIPKDLENTVVCGCETPELKAYKDRNDELVLECQKCLGFLKYPKVKE